MTLNLISITSLFNILKLILDCKIPLNCLIVQLNIGMVIMYPLSSNTLLDVSETRGRERIGSYPS